MRNITSVALNMLPEIENKRLPFLGSSSAIHLLDEGSKKSPHIILNSEDYIIPDGRRSAEMRNEIAAKGRSMQPENFRLRKLAPQAVSYKALQPEEPSPEPRERKDRTYIYSRAQITQQVEKIVRDESSFLVGP